MKMCGEKLSKHTPPQLGIFRGADAVALEQFDVCGVPTTTTLCVCGPSRGEGQSSLKKGNRSLRDGGEWEILDNV